MHFIIGFAILVFIFAVFPRTAILFATLSAAGGVLILIVAAIASHW
jgi:hypothetical protein